MEDDLQKMEDDLKNKNKMEDDLKTKQKNEKQLKFFSSITKITTSKNGR